MSAAAPSHGASPIPVTVIGGYLGAGKTTLVNHLLRQAAGLRLAVLVNDFGELPIDADLIDSRDGNVIGIAGGCVCCSYGSDLIAALMDLAQRQPRIEHVLLETSGVALPGQVASALALLPDYALDAVVTLVDAGSVRRHATDHYLADTITRQLADAHLIVLNKLDLVALDARRELEAWLQQQAPQARLMPTQHAVAPLPVILGQQLAHTQASDPTPDVHHGHDTAAYVSRAFPIPCVRNVAGLIEALLDPSLGLLRVKGIVTEPDGAAFVAQIAGGHPSVTPALPTQAARGLVVIGLATHADLDRTSRIIASHAASSLSQ